jgi:hypothetical protein
MGAGPALGQVAVILRALEAMPRVQDNEALGEPLVGGGAPRGVVPSVPDQAIRPANDPP